MVSSTEIKHGMERSSQPALGWAGIKPVLVRACQMLRSVTAGLAEPATPLRQELTILVGNADANTLLSNLSGASGDLASLGPLLGLSQVAEGRLSRETYLERFGHRGTHEMELSAPARMMTRPGSKNKWRTSPKCRWKSKASWQTSVMSKLPSGPFRVPLPGKTPAIRRRLEKVAAAAKNREAVRSE